MQEKNKPTVSVFMITYNHEKYIAEALDSILMQEVDFHYEIVVGEDCSTDNTRNILLKYRDRFPNKFKLLLHDKNIGMMSNVIATMEACKGKYIAMIEGDDYWVDSLKLHKQVNFLENNSDYTMCFSSSFNYDQTKKMVISEFPNLSHDKDYELSDMLKGNIANTCTVVYRNINIVLPSVFKTFSLADWPISLLYAEKGKVRYIGENMATYRVHSDGVWTQSQHVIKIKHSVNMLLRMNIYFKRKHEKEIYESIARLLLTQSFKHLQLKEFQRFLYIYQKSKNFASISIKETIIIFINSFFNNLLKTIVSIKKKLTR